jgi:hypothetical protein
MKAGSVHLTKGIEDFNDDTDLHPSAHTQLS